GDGRGDRRSDWRRRDWEWGGARTGAHEHVGRNRRRGVVAPQRDRGTAGWRRRGETDGPSRVLAPGDKRRACRHRTQLGRAARWIISKLRHFKIAGGQRVEGRVDDVIIPVGVV